MLSTVNAIVLVPATSNVHATVNASALPHATEKGGGTTTPTTHPPEAAHNKFTPLPTSPTGSHVHIRDVLECPAFALQPAYVATLVQRIEQRFELYGRAKGTASPSQTAEAATTPTPTPTPSSPRPLPVPTATAGSAARASVSGSRAGRRLGH